jgi:hypothetical protein
MPDQAQPLPKRINRELLHRATEQVVEHWQLQVNASDVGDLVYIDAAEFEELFKQFDSRFEELVAEYRALSEAGRFAALHHDSFADLAAAERRVSSTPPAQVALKR